MHIIHFDAGAWRVRRDDDFTADNVVRVADALGLVWADAHAGATVLVGYDTRADAARHAALAGSVMAAYGLNVVVSEGPVPTPAVAWSAAHDPSCVGAVMLAASQTLAGRGGILVRGADGGPASAAFLSDVEHAVSGEATAARGVVSYADLSSAYVDDVLTRVDVGAIAEVAPHVVADSLYGAMGPLLASVLRRAGIRASVLRDGANGACPGLAPRPFEPWVDAAEQLVSSSGAACGLVFNGDGTRVTLIDEHDGVVDPHTVVSLLLGHIVARGDVVSRQTRVVTTMASSARIRRKATLLGLETTVVPVGFDRLYAEVCEGDVLLASEEYGGVCLPTHLPERDGLLVGLLAVELIAQGGRSVTDHVRALEREVGHMRYGHRDINLDAAQIQTLRNLLPGLNPAQVAGRVPVAVNHADGLRLGFDDDSWLMLRPARTQSVVRAYAEAPSMQQRDELLQAAHELALGHR